MKKSTSPSFLASLCTTYSSLPVVARASLLASWVIIKCAILAYFTGKLVLLDLAYPLAFVLAGWVYYHHFQQHKYVFAPLLVWAVRLSGFLLWRLCYLTDWRYTPEGWKFLFANGNTSYLLWCLTMCLLTSGISSVLYFCFGHSKVKGYARTLSLTMIFLAIFGEALADYQLTSYRLTHSPADVCQTGLWAFSRHPNYLFDLLVWVAFAWLGRSWYGLLSPALLACYQLYLNIPLLERHCRDRKPGYETYCSRVGVLLPHPGRSDEQKGDPAPSSRQASSAADERVTPGE